MASPTIERGRVTSSPYKDGCGSCERADGPDSRETSRLILQHFEELPTLPASCPSCARGLARRHARPPDRRAHFPRSSLTPEASNWVSRRLGTRARFTQVERAVVFSASTPSSCASWLSPSSRLFPRRDRYRSQQDPRSTAKRSGKHCLAVACCAELWPRGARRHEPRSAAAVCLLCGSCRPARSHWIRDSCPELHRVVRPPACSAGNMPTARQCYGLDPWSPGEAAESLGSFRRRARTASAARSSPTRCRDVPHPALVNLITLGRLLVPSSPGYSGNYSFTRPRARLLTRRLDRPGKRCDARDSSVTKPRATCAWPRPVSS